MVYYNFENIEEYLNLFDIKKLKKECKSKKHVKYYNIPVTFDTETTNCYIENDTNKVYIAKDIALLREKLGKDFNEKNYKKFSFMYIWMMSIDDNIIIGRTWEEYKILCKKLIEKFDLGIEYNMIIYVRNLSFEFQFLKSIFNFDKIFASESHKIIYGITGPFEYRCSYFLSGCSLETTGKNLKKYKAEKQIGKLDYNEIRTKDTVLTKEEIEYCLYDVIVDSNFIRESMEDEKGNSILKLPLTKTGYVRRYCKKYCLNEDNRLNYKKIIDKFSYDEKSFKQLKRCYAGAFTHANALNVGNVFKNVASYDFTSSYPFCLIAFKYPISKGYDYKIKNLKDFRYNLKRYCCIFDIRFYNIREKENVCENIISVSKCFNSCNVTENNGRLVSADYIDITINEVDFECIEKFYDFDEIKIANFKRYVKGYLPKPLIECILHFYEGKTSLKDVPGKEREYALLKSMLNSIYGMCVTDPVKDEYYLNDDNNWEVNLADLNESLEHYNNSKSRFIAYEWGIWCTSYARRNLFSGVKELGNDFIYADTDSLKFINLEKHLKYFEIYNNWVIGMLNNMCKFYNIPFEKVAPKTIKGEEKIIGVYDFEGVYDRFKTLGAKRYAYENLRDVNGNITKKGKGFNITVSGVNKKTAVPYLIEESKKKKIDIFDLFDNELYIGCEYSGKLLHTYCDIPFETYVTDYQGNKTFVCEKSFVHLEPTSYSMSLCDTFIKYLKKVNIKYKRDC